jgi:hypothetical protein
LLGFALLCFFPDVALALQPERLPSQQWPTDCHGVTAEKMKNTSLTMASQRERDFPATMQSWPTCYEKPYWTNLRQTVLHHRLLVLAVRSF